MTRPPLPRAAAFRFGLWNGPGRQTARSFPILHPAPAPFEGAEMAQLRFAYGGIGRRANCARSIARRARAL